MSNLKVVKKIIVINVLFILILLIPVVAMSADLGDAWGGDKLLDKAAGSGGAGYKTATSVEDIISKIIQIALSFLGVVFLVLLIYGGFLWMNARGNEEQVTKAKNLITAAIIGLIIVISAYAISWYVISKLESEALNVSPVPTSQQSQQGM